MNLTAAFIEGIGGPELMMILFVVLLLFGADKLPELARGMGKSIKVFKRAASGVEEQLKEAFEESPESKRFAPVPPKPPATFPPYPPGSGPAQPPGTVGQQPAGENLPPAPPAQ